MAESQQTEYKQTWRDEYLKWISGFANAEGGVLVIGRDDAGKVVGLKDAKKLLEDIPNKVRDLLGILVAVNLRTEGKLEYLEIEVEPYPNPISHKGKYYLPSGSTLQELKGAALDRFILRAQGKTWDGVPVPHVGVADLSSAAIASFRKLATASGRLERKLLDEPAPILIEKLKLTEGDYLKRAAVLLFHEDPERFVTGAFVKVGFFRSESDLVYHDEIHGDLFTQTAQTVDLIRTKYLKAAIHYEGLQRIETYPIPYDALREAVLNALIHRDYAITAPIQIKVFADRLKIWNPAVLPYGWDLAKLLGDHASHPFNPDIANAFFRAGEIESWGRGIQRIFEACRQGYAPAPVIRLSGHDLWTEFPFSPKYLKLIDASSGEKVGEKVGEKLSENRQKILESIQLDPKVSQKKLAEILGIATKNIETNISYLKQHGYLRRVGPAKGGHWELLK
ncbi:ATP-binding protein [Coraliomargarita algicola]|uniref:ATP-binding protein n=1 Tax=Coraliomargarita algicola TaxID=3092156 RepID=A0ABZ0RK53_9BACT|nr:ATP-binding protein [Coraliomargarita sp. J2-16]WPJ96584.1 ATP-binding protein [Coraliomargarita sp. J2-16]